MINAIYILVALGFIAWVTKDLVSLRKNKQIEDSSNVYRLNVPDREKRMVRSMFRSGDYKIKNEYLHHYEFTIDGESVVLGIASIAGIIEELENNNNTAQS